MGIISDEQYKKKDRTSGILFHTTSRLVLHLLDFCPNPMVPFPEHPSRHDLYWGLPGILCSPVMSSPLPLLFLLPLFLLSLAHIHGIPLLWSLECICHLDSQISILYP